MFLKKNLLQEKRIKLRNLEEQLQQLEEKAADNVSFSTLGTILWKRLKSIVFGLLTLPSLPHGSGRPF